ncbi:hypothetical protein ABIA33_006560 [Streptacidiphilus sp. MAP12-16]|uniref:tetratricopeptide repeat protein n=1 Tax=Streptacidiphilus sp. MAP12-16 TaxID=3156300 RepID=UPI003511F46A
MGEDQGPVRVEQHAEASGHAIVNQAGRDQYITQQAPPPRPESWPQQVGVLPREADCFQSRDEVALLDGALVVGGSAVLVGTGGVGKSQLAAHYARAVWNANDVDLLVWITASSREAIIAGYGRAGVEVADATPGAPEEAASRFLTWTQICERRWLIVLDDVADPADLRGLWPPERPEGRVVVSTRRRDSSLVGSKRHRIEVGLFAPAEASAYLSTKLEAFGRQDSASQIAGLAQDLGYLPLALSQAAAYVLDDGLNVAEYRKLLADRVVALADVLPEQDALPDDQSATVAAAWSLSVERADQLRPVGLARPMLELAAVLNPNAIPAEVLFSVPVLTYLTIRRTRWTPGDDWTEDVQLLVTADEAYRALRVLHRLTLIDHIPGTLQQTVRIHQLVQRAVRDPLTPGHRDWLARVVADSLLVTWPEVARDSVLAESLRANVMALTRHAGDALFRPGVHDVLHRAGQSMGETGQVTSATTYLRDLAETAEHLMGPWHLDTLSARLHLAVWQGHAGDVSGAATALTLLVQDLARIVGPGHPLTLTARINLAQRRGQMGDIGQAVADYEQFLPALEVALGPSHPATLVARSSLAIWQGQAGDIARSVTATEELLEDLARAVGSDHPETLVARGNLAFLRGQAGKTIEAVADYEQLLPATELALGPDHPVTLAMRNGLAYWQGQSGDIESTVIVSEQVLEDRLRVMDPDHPETLVARAHLAVWRGEAGDIAEAASGLGQLLPDLMRVLGPDHPMTLGARAGLANWQGQAGDIAGAISAFDHLMPDLERALGASHPDSLNARAVLIHWRRQGGDVAWAEEAMQQLVSDMLRAMGPDAVGAVTSQSALSIMRGEAMDASDLRQRLHLFAPVLGLDRLGTLAARGDLSALMLPSQEPTDLDLLLRGLAQLVDPESLAGVIRDFARELDPDRLIALAIQARTVFGSSLTGGAPTLLEGLLELLQGLGPEVFEMAVFQQPIVPHPSGEGEDGAAIQDMVPEIARLLGVDSLDSIMARILEMMGGAGGE